MPSLMVPVNALPLTVNPVNEPRPSRNVGNGPSKLRFSKTRLVTLKASLQAIPVQEQWSAAVSQLKLAPLKEVA